jgi:alpha-tubulin suppressor-like RCC1 family protein
MAVVLQSNTITGLDSLTVSTTTSFTGNAYASPTASTASRGTQIANTNFVDAAATRPYIDQLITGGSNGIFFISEGKLYECHGASGTNNYIGGRHSAGADYVYGISRTSQVPIPDSSPVIKAFGTKHALALCANGNLYTWGYNGYGQLGLGDTSDRVRPTLSATGVTDFFYHETQGGGYYMYDSKSIIKKSDGYLYSCGYNGYGQLGIGGTAGTNSTWTQMTAAGTNPLFVGNFGNSYGMTVVQKSDKTIWMCGYNGYGTFGDSTTAGPNQFTNVDSSWRSGNSNLLITGMWGGSGYAAPTGQGYCNIGLLLDDGTNTVIRTAGANNWSSLGTGDTTNRYTAFTVTMPSGSGRIKKVVQNPDAVGSVYALAENGNLYSWGYNGYGQLGFGDTTDRSTPTLTNSGVTDIYYSCSYQYGHYHMQQINKSGQIWNAGYNGNATSGNGVTSSNQTTWTKALFPYYAQIKLLGNFSTTGNTRQMVAVSTNNTVYGWGYNYQYGVYYWRQGYVNAPQQFEIFRGQD